jgi:hypothetical protein
VEHAITVTPRADGWQLKCTACDQAEQFRSGADAEAAAHALGMRIAATGATAVIHIFLRDGALGGRFVHAPQGGDPGTMAEPGPTRPAHRPASRQA